MKQDINPDNFKKDYSYPEQNTDDIQNSIYKKKEFYMNRSQERKEFKNYSEIKKFRDEVCDKSKFEPHFYQKLLPNFINPETPYKGLIIFHGLGSGKTTTGYKISEKFINQCKKHKTKICILVPGPNIKETWKQTILDKGKETYMQHVDKSAILNKEEREILEKNAWNLISQYYKIMSYKSFYKRVTGERIVEKSTDGNKIKNIYKKDDEGKFERDLSGEPIYNLNNTLLIIDEAHQITGSKNMYGEAVAKIINNSINLKVLLMTATPMKNLADDFIYLLNFLRPKNEQISRDKIFNQQKNYKMDFKPGGEDYLRKMAMGYVSYIFGADNLTYAKRIDIGEIPKGLYFTKVIKCSMKNFQKKIYYDNVEEQKKELDDLDNEEENELEDNKRDTLDKKSESICNFVFPALSENRTEIIGKFGISGINLIRNQLKENKTILNSKISQLLYNNDDVKDCVTLSNDGKNISGKIFHVDNLKHFSTKFHTALTNLEKLVVGKNGIKTAFIYSNLVKVGIELFREVLLQNGYLEYQHDEQNYQITPDVKCYYCGIEHKNHGDIGENSEKNKNINLHYFAPATFIIFTGSSGEDTIDNSQEEKMKTVKNVFNAIGNKEGRYIKFILGSKVINEGVNLENIGEVHILDVYFNLGRVDQAIGRGIRYCSHWRIMNENNVFPEVKTYKYVVGIDEGLSTEEELYKKAELKHITVKKVERIMKETAIDCPLNYQANLLNKNDLEKYKNCEKEGEYKCPDFCDYMDCHFKCYGNKLNLNYYDQERNVYKKIAKENLDVATFSHELARSEIENVKKKIKELFILEYSYSLHEILDLVKKNLKGEKQELFDEFYVFKALDELLPISENDFNNFKDIITDRFHRQGYLIFRGDHYIFQAFDQDQKTSLYYRSSIQDKIYSSMSLYSYLKITNQISHDHDRKSNGDNNDNNDNNDDENNDNIINYEETFYDFDSTMDYYNSREENSIVGIIDKELNKKKNCKSDETDIFKIREKRGKTLEKKRATGLPSLKGAVCATAKEKEYLLSIAKTLDINTNRRKITRCNLCDEIKEKMLLLEKYDTNSTTFIMIPADHPKYNFPYNLIDRRTHIINKINSSIRSNINVNYKTVLKTNGDEKGMPSYVVTIINNNENINDIHIINAVLKKYKAVEIEKNKKWEILVE